MKFLIPVLLLAFIACTSPQKDGYNIKGKIEGATQEYALLKSYENGKIKTIDSVKITDGVFSFNGTVNEPDIYSIFLGNNKVSLFIENANISVIGHIDSLKKAIIKGSKMQDNFVAYNNSKKEFEDQLKDLYTLYRNAESEEEMAKIEIAYDSIDNAKNMHIKEYIKANSSSYLAPYIIRRELIHSLDLAELENLTNTVSPELKDYKYTQQLLERIEILRNVQPGKIAPEFTQNDPDGNPVNLSDYKGKYLLIDFWASWCTPCRKANPTVVAMYNKYHAKDFDILGISMDSNKDKWLEAIEVDGLTWKHVSTLEGWANPVGKLYGVNSIPHAVLIDKEGKIVKRGIHAGELDEVLADLLK